MKIAVVGCGSMGCYFGAKLSKKNEVIYIDAFQKSIDSLNQNGITLKEGDKEESYVAPAFLAGKYKGSVDLVLLFVKSTQNIAALSQNETLFNEHTIVMSLQNGFGIEREISRYVSPENIIVGNTAINCVKEDIGVVKLANGGITILGSLVDNKKLALTGKVLLNQAGFETEVSDDIRRVIWENAFVNVTLNPLTAFFNCKTKVCYENKNIWALVESIVNETLEVAKLDGYNFDSEKILEQIRNICINFGKGYTPMYQDVKNKRFTEIEKLNGQIVNLAYKYKMDAPNNEFVLNAIKAIERLY